MKKTNIEWCDTTWNPITGCLHDCPYCYAHGIARRFGTFGEEKSAYEFGDDFIEEFHVNNDINKPIMAVLHENPEKEPYPFDFFPTFHRYRLNEPAKIKKSRTVFVGSMADIFGEWIPDEWVQEVFKACEAAPQHTYLFLTKNPTRYGRIVLHEAINPYVKQTNSLEHIKIHDMMNIDDIRAVKNMTHQENRIRLQNEGYKMSVMKSAQNWMFPNNMYLGVTITTNKQAEKRNYGLSSRAQGFLSIEPIEEKINLEFDEKERGFIKLVIVGAETGRRKGKIIPKREWIADIVNACRTAGIPVFLKNNLAEIWGEPLIQELPWEV